MFPIPISGKYKCFKFNLLMKACFIRFLQIFLPFYHHWFLEKLYFLSTKHTSLPGQEKFPWRGLHRGTFPPTQTPSSLHLNVTSLLMEKPLHSSKTFCYYNASAEYVLKSFLFCYDMTICWFLVFTSSNYFDFDFDLAKLS